MEFYFCETCGKRVTEHDIEGGVAKNKKLKGVFCQDCAIGVTTMETLPLSDTDARKLLGKGTSGTRGRARRRGDSLARGGRRTPGGGSAGVSDRRASRESDRLWDRRQGTPLKIAGGILAAVVVLALGFFLFSGDSGKPTTKKTSSRRKSVAAKGPQEQTSQKHARSRADAGATESPPIRGVAAQKQDAANDGREASSAANTPPTSNAMPKALPTSLPADVPRMDIRKPTSVPTIDGSLDDRCWSDATPMTLRYIQGSRRPPDASSEVRLLVSRTHFYIGARLAEPRMSQLTMPNRGRDTKAWADDCIEVFFVPGLDPLGTKYQWVTNIAGNIWDGKGMGRSSDPRAWDVEAECKIRLAKDAWFVEAAIPLSAMGDASKEAYWRFNVTRNRPKLENVERYEEFTSWSVLNSTSTQVPSRYGVIALEAFGGVLPKR